MPWLDVNPDNREKFFAAQKEFENWIENYLEIAEVCRKDNLRLCNEAAAKFYAGQAEALHDCLRMLRVVGLLEWKRGVE